MQSGAPNLYGAQTRTCRDDLHSAVGGDLIQMCNKPTTSTKEGRETWAGKIAQTESMNTFADQTYCMQGRTCATTWRKPTRRRTEKKLYASINFQQVTACVTTWRKPQRRWSKKNLVMNMIEISEDEVSPLHGANE